MYTDKELQAAKKRVKAKKGFYQHLMSFTIINLFLMALNFLTTPAYNWFVYPLLGWGIGLAFHYVEVFGIPGFDILSREWEERELDIELKKQRQDEQGRKVLLPPGTASPKAEEPMKLKELRKRYDDSEFV